LKSRSGWLVLAAAATLATAFATWPADQGSEVVDLVESVQKDAEKKEQATPAEIDRLIEQLGARDFKVREAAVKRLRSIGIPALKALQDAEEHPDLETRQRALLLVSQIREKNQLPTRVDGVEFELVVGRKEWMEEKFEFGDRPSCSVELRITNTRKTLRRIYHSTESVVPVLQTADGKMLEMSEGQARTGGDPFVPPPLKQNETLTFRFTARLYWGEHGFGFVFENQASHEFCYWDLSRGEYRLSISYIVAGDIPEVDGPLWKVKAVTRAEKLVIK
jgi:hypothetical protein